MSDRGSAVPIVTQIERMANEMKRVEHQSAQPCGCDMGADHICEWHTRHGLSLPKRAVPVVTQEQRANAEHARVQAQTRSLGPSPDTFINKACWISENGPELKALPRIRTFDTGATRNSDANKPDYEGYLSPQVIEAFGRYMTKHRVQEDGSIRASDNWQKGIPRNVYMKSGFRHFMDCWKLHRRLETDKGDFLQCSLLEESLCALLFNVMGYLHEFLGGR